MCYKCTQIGLSLASRLRDIRAVTVMNVILLSEYVRLVLVLQSPF